MYIVARVSLCTVVLVFVGSGNGISLKSDSTQPKESCSQLQ